MRPLVRALRDDVGYAGLRCLLAGSRALPLPVLRALGRAVGTIAFRFAGKDRARARTHLELAFSERGLAWREHLLHSSSRHLGTLLGEVAWLWSAPAPAILARTEFVAAENLTGALARDRGALLVTGHCGNWEWLNLGLGARGVPMTVAAREVYDPRLDEVARRLRGRFGGATALRGKGAGTKLVQALRRGRVVGLLIDQDIDAPGVYVEFLGHPAWTPSGAALLALRTGCPVVTGFAARLPDGTMRLAFDPPIEPRPGGDEEEEIARLTALFTSRIERQVRAYPEQWVWMHRRWRHQPGEGERVWRVPPADDGGETPAGAAPLG